MKIVELPLDEEVKRDVIDKIIRQRTERSARLPLYCWKNEDGVASEAFFSKQDAVKNWYIKNRLWEQKNIPKGVLLYEWSAPLNEIIEHLKDNKIIDIPISTNSSVQVALSLQEFHEDIKQTLQKQG